jgi:WD40 repeat protein
MRPESPPLVCRLTSAPVQVPPNSSLPSRGVSSIAFRSNTQLLTSDVHYARLSLWDLTSAEILRSLGRGTSESAPQDFVSIALNAERRLLASGTPFGDVHLWDLDAGELIRTFEEDDEDRFASIRSVAFCPVTGILAIGDHDGRISIWNPISGLRLRFMDGPPDPVSRSVLMANS